MPSRYGLALLGRFVTVFDGLSGASHFLERIHSVAVIVVGDNYNV
jgi:hypothetical protein